MYHHILEQEIFLVHVGGFSWGDIEEMPPFDRKRVYERILGVKEREAEKIAEMRATNARIKRNVNSSGR